LYYEEGIRAQSVITAGRDTCETEAVFVIVERVQNADLALYDDRSSKTLKKEFQRRDVLREEENR